MAGPALALGYQQLTVSTTAVSVTTPSGGADTCQIRVATNGVRYRDDGVAPTAAVGVPLNAGDTLLYTGQPEDLQFIRSGGADAVLDILYYNADAGQYPNVFPGTASSGGATVVDTELPAAAALATGAANPTTPTVGAAKLVWNGTTWDRAKGVVAGGVAGPLTDVGLPATAIYLRNGSANNYYPWNTPNGYGDGSDGATLGIGNVATWAFNGTNYDRMRGDATKGQQVYSTWAYNYISTATTVQVKSGAGVLHAINVNHPVAASTVKVIDNTSGTTANIATIDSINVQTLIFDVAFATGLRIVTSGATDITVSYA